MQLIRALMILVLLSAFSGCAAVEKETEPAAIPVPVAEPAGGWKVIQPKGVDGLGNFENDPARMIDGKFMQEHSVWNAAGCVWWSTYQGQLVVDLGKPCIVAGIVIQLGSNNDYVIYSSLKAKSYRRLVEIKRSYFKTRLGMETLASLPGRADSVPQMAFQPVKARYLKLQAVGSVNHEFSVSEIEVFGTCPDTAK
jgi:hypothetical protein